MKDRQRPAGASTSLSSPSSAACSRYRREHAGAVVDGRARPTRRRPAAASTASAAEQLVDVLLARPSCSRPSMRKRRSAAPAERRPPANEETDPAGEAEPPARSPAPVPAAVGVARPARPQPSASPASSLRQAISQIREQHAAQGSEQAAPDSVRGAALTASQGRRGPLPVRRRGGAPRSSTRRPSAPGRWSPGCT